MSQLPAPTIATPSRPGAGRGGRGVRGRAWGGVAGGHGGAWQGAGELRKEAHKLESFLHGAVAGEGTAGSRPGRLR